jgi:hypothetical protein
MSVIEHKVSCEPCKNTNLRAPPVMMMMYAKFARSKGASEPGGGFPCVLRPTARVFIYNAFGQQPGSCVAG